MLLETGAVRMGERGVLPSSTRWENLRNGSASGFCTHHRQSLLQMRRNLAGCGAGESQGLFDLECQSVVIASADFRATSR